MSDAITVSTHVLDTAYGAPAANIAVTLERVDAPGGGSIVATGITGADGRIPSLSPTGAPLSAGTYRLSYDVAGYFAETQRKSFYSEICIDFIVTADPEHYHVPLLLSPFGYSTYRGS
ncbi:MAG: hydroxyisourate hydrolase [bacterium]